MFFKSKNDGFLAQIYFPITFYSLDQGSNIFKIRNIIYLYGQNKPELTKLFDFFYTTVSIVLCPVTYDSNIKKRVLFYWSFNGSNIKIIQYKGQGQLTVKGSSNRMLTRFQEPTLGQVRLCEPISDERQFFRTNWLKISENAYFIKSRIPIFCYSLKSPGAIFFFTFQKHCSDQANITDPIYA